jgi:CRP/FNR family cyclic AMP-dependent transcriptional regulator
MRCHPDRHPWNVRALLESTATPFTIASFGPRAAIFRQGDSCDGVMYIERGQVWLAVTEQSGKEAICGLLGTGAFLGEEAVTGCGERRQSATAMTATQVLAVAKAHMNRLLRTQPGLLDRFIAHLLARNIVLETNLAELLLYSSEQRLAHALVALAHCDQRRRRQCALPDLTQEIIAEMVGTTRSRVSTLMSQFKKRGLIEDRSGRLYVNPARLDVVRDRDPRTSIAAHPKMSTAAR